MKRFGQHFLLVYSAALTTVLAVVLLTGASTHQKRSFDEIQVHRIDVVEPDGTLRMVISNKNRLPPVIVKGVEHPDWGEPRPQAGMLFYNDEGSENGGLIFGGHKNEKGDVIDSGGSLSFDKYGEGQIVQLAGVDDANDRFAGIAVNGNKKRRIWVGTADNGNASIALMDTNGRKRIIMEVPEQGDPSLSFLDEKGIVVRQLLPKQ